MAIANITGNILTDSGVATSSLLPLTGGTLTGALNGTSAVFSGFLGVNGSPGTAFPFEAYINSSTAYSSTSRGNVMRVYNSNTGANVFAGIELGGAGTANDGLAGLNAIVTGSGSAALTFYTRDGGTFAERVRVAANGNVGIGVSSANGLLSLKAEQTNTPTIVFQNTSGGANSAISNFTVNNQTYTVIGTNSYVNNAGNISRFNTSYAGSFVAFDEGDIVLATGTSGITPTARMRVLSGGDINTLGGNIRALGGGFVLRDSANTTTGGLFTKRMNWLGSGSDLSPAIAAETGYGIYTYTNGNASPSGPYVAPGGTTWTNGSSDVRKKKNFETTQGLAEILQVEPIKYHFNEDDDSSKKRLGFKAQNILNLIPEMVSETGEIAEDGTPYLTITPDYILPVLVKAIQELNAKVSALENKS